MAEINLSLAEIVDIVAANSILPKQITNIVVDENMISFRYHTKLAFPSHIDASVQFLKYENGIAELEFTTSWLVEKIIKSLAVFKNEFIELRGSRIRIQLKKLLADKLAGISLESIEFINHRFEIKFYTTH